jgi:cytochrome c oxidase subunit 4
MILHVSKRMLLAVIASLLVLTAVSLGVSYLPMPDVASVIVALLIAAVKVSLVVLFFMEVIEHGGGVRLAAVTGPVFLVTLILLMLGDIWTR